MSSIDLTSSQKTILRALVDRYIQTDAPVTGERIADAIDRHPGTIRNQMQSLKTVGLAEGVPGPQGGYRPTEAAFDLLGIEQTESQAVVPITRNGARVEDINVQDIQLATVQDPERCQAKIDVQGPITVFEVGDAVSVGPTPKANLRIDGTVVDKDKAQSLLILSIDDMQAPAREPAE